MSKTINSVNNDSRQQRSSSGYLSLDLNASIDLNESSRAFEVAKGSVSVKRMSKYERQNSVKPSGNSSIKATNALKDDAIAPDIPERRVTVTKVSRFDSAKSIDSSIDEETRKIGAEKHPKDTCASPSAINVHVSETVTSALTVVKLQRGWLTRNDLKTNLNETTHLKPIQQPISANVSRQKNSIVTVKRLSRTITDGENTVVPAPSMPQCTRAKSLEILSDRKISGNREAKSTNPKKINSPISVTVKPIKSTLILIERKRSSTIDNISNAQSVTVIPIKQERKSITVIRPLQTVTAKVHNSST
ncbi:unnamed protein product [Didymodactylos carnosus]|uniref:Uncharacterized protein n=1 Tax=Didymodactylos carnosus TaxID=1234261 RepID=A0A814NJV6_9BILA|nr:unnamed protein product [Didymodactylos carnosus]CAF3859369.1 unnamed protein product [Didymodactylos carnosus]